VRFDFAEVSARLSVFAVSFMWNRMLLMLMMMMMTMTMTMTLQRMFLEGSRMWRGRSSMDSLEVDLQPISELSTINGG